MGKAIMGLIEASLFIIWRAGWQWPYSRWRMYRWPIEEQADRFLQGWDAGILECVRKLHEVVQDGRFPIPGDFLELKSKREAHGRAEA